MAGLTASTLRSSCEQSFTHPSVTPQDTGGGKVRHLRISAYRVTTLLPSHQTEAGDSIFTNYDSSD